MQFYLIQLISLALNLKPSYLRSKNKINYEVNSYFPALIHHILLLFLAIFHINISKILNNIIFKRKYVFINRYILKTDNLNV